LGVKLPVTATTQALGRFDYAEYIRRFRAGRDFGVLALLTSHVGY